MQYLKPSVIYTATVQPCPPNLSSFWNFGSCLGLILGIQILSGLFLSIHYCCSSDYAFDSVSHILRDVVGGWFLRSLHANGASFFFLVIYLHIGRGIYFGSYILVSTWYTGIFMLLLTIGSAFLGYVLPWGQISFWGATVITNLLSALPYFGSSLVTWVWGGFSVDNAALTRFYTLHFLIPFLLTAASLVHIYFLHTTGSNNPLGLVSYADMVPFHIYYTINDIFGFCVLITSLLLVVLLCPLLFMEADNFIPANSLVTPVHIVPEWYFLFAYAILRCVPSKLGGVCALLGSILCLATLSFTHFQLIKGLTFYGPVKGLFWIFVTVFVLLTLAGSWPVVLPYTIVTAALSVLYFLFFVLLSLLRWIWDLALV